MSDCDEGAQYRVSLRWLATACMVSDVKLNDLIQAAKLYPANFQFISLSFKCSAQPTSSCKSRHPLYNLVLILSTTTIYFNPWTYIFLSPFQSCDIVSTVPYYILMRTNWRFENTPRQRQTVNSSSVTRSIVPVGLPHRTWSLLKRPSGN